MNYFHVWYEHCWWSKVYCNTSSGSTCYAMTVFQTVGTERKKTVLEQSRTIFKKNKQSLKKQIKTFSKLECFLLPKSFSIDPKNEQEGETEMILLWGDDWLRIPFHHVIFSSETTQTHSTRRIPQTQSGIRRLRPIL